ncbi:MAG: hypothetical protein EBX36_04500 [Planctomycetia bacterium]|nr:hypothetical protein [Planctomycetia bacterium]
MVREDLVSLCERYVRHRDAAATGGGPAHAPAEEIVRSFRLAEISASEMQALLAYIDDSEDDDAPLGSGPEATVESLGVYDGLIFEDLEDDTADDDDDDVRPPLRPR